MSRRRAAATPSEDLIIAIENLDVEAVRGFMEAADWDRTYRSQSDGWSLLHWAIDAEVDAHLQEGGALAADMTKLLLAFGVDPQLRNKKGETALEMAQRCDHTPAIEVLRDSEQGLPHLE